MVTLLTIATSSHARLVRPDSAAADQLKATATLTMEVTTLGTVLFPMAMLCAAGRAVHGAAPAANAGPQRRRAKAGTAWCVISH